MRTAIIALTEELRRLQGTGIKSVVVSDEAVEALREAVRGLKVEATSTSPSLPAGEAVVAAQSARVGIKGDVDIASTSIPPPVVAATVGTKQERWDALKAQVLADENCRRNVRAGKKVVLGVGSLDAQIMFVGEAPGADEEVQGEPFVGPAGQLLTKMIQAMGLQRSSVYIGNIMNWRPQLPANEEGVQFGNRPPTPEEMAYCLPYLKAQIEIVNPAFLVALGASAAQGLLGAGSFRALGEVRGQWREFAGRPLMITYHPSYILRNQSNRSKRMIWEDLLRVMEKAALPISDKQRGFFLDK